MSKKISRLDSLHIQKPCPVDWQQMTGDEQTRFCQECNKHVYNLSAMTRRQAEAMIATSRGNLCVRFNRQADGTLLTMDEVSTFALKLPPPNRRPSPVASAVVSALMAVSPAMAAPSSLPILQPAAAVADLHPLPTQAKPQGGTAGLKGRVTTFSEAKIGGAMVMLINENTGEMFGAVTAESGEYEIEATGSGVFILRVEAEGFKAQTVHGITLNSGKQRRADVSLQSNDYSVGGAMAYAAEPLRTLYNESDRVVVATVGKAVKIGKEHDSTLRKIALTVSSTVKGEHQSTLYVYEYVYKDEPSQFVKDERVLVFLQRRESQTGIEDGYDLSGYREGLKKLDDADLKIYLQRLEELKNLQEKEDNGPAETVEWLVRCVEDKATRAEGAYELAAEASQLRYRQERQARSKAEKPEKAEAEMSDAETAEGTANNEAPKVEATVTENPQPEEKEPINLFALLTPQQKERLMIVLLSAEALTDINYELVEIAKEWKDARLQPFLLDHLRRVQADPPAQAQSAIYALAEFFADEKLKKAAEEYAKQSRSEDEEEADEQPATATQSQASANFSQQRSVLLKEFLALVEAEIKQQNHSERESKTAAQTQHNQ
ncbi:MAG: carboxypeptidase regulatory-like domain-containing protein [Acidobacteria bacterium]|nr:carboxypeptidase regulatory-like domain-containing protein [Acidobacteriota bacterium]